MASSKRLFVLMADDGSQHAQAAIELLGDLSLPPKSRVSVLRVFTPGQIDVLPAFEKSLEATKQRLLDKGIQAQAEVMLGHPAEKIIEVAAETRPGLILLGAKGLRATLGILLGGVAQQVVEYANCPVLVVRAPYRGLKRILIVTDGSPTSQIAVRYLGKFPLPPGIELHVLHVLPPEQQPVAMEIYSTSWRTSYIPIISEEEQAAYLKRTETAGQALLKRTCELLQRHGLESTPVLLRGDAATEIIDYVNSNHIDLIVAGSRGLSEFKGWWVGSVSRKLVHYSNCSVLIVKAPHKE
jgi:nucleotide-binding universal stress UspA family protein